MKSKERVYETAVDPLDEMIWNRVQLNNELRAIMERGLTQVNCTVYLTMPAQLPGFMRDPVHNL